ncbi:hypothetical protein MTBUT4_90076 [Magnetospirillum sp. UT-4]|nr:hypothetical protein MTBUT4_90076 [Magnetospirillum sp. UT-4]
MQRQRSNGGSHGCPGQLRTSRRQRPPCRAAADAGAHPGGEAAARPRPGAGGGRPDGHRLRGRPRPVAPDPGRHPGPVRRHRRAGPPPGARRRSRPPVRRCRHPEGAGQSVALHHPVPPRQRRKLGRYPGRPGRHHPVGAVAASGAPARSRPGPHPAPAPARLLFPGRAGGGRIGGVAVRRLRRGAGQGVRVGSAPRDVAPKLIEPVREAPA